MKALSGRGHCTSTCYGMNARDKVTAGRQKEETKELTGTRGKSPVQLLHLCPGFQKPGEERFPTAHAFPCVWPALPTSRVKVYCVVYILFTPQQLEASVPNQPQSARYCTCSRQAHQTATQTQTGSAWQLPDELLSQLEPGQALAAGTT